MAQALGDGALARRDGRARPTTCARCGPTCTGTAASGCAASEPLGYGEATGALGEIGDLDDLLDQLGQEHPGRDPGRRRRRGGASGSSAGRAADDVRRLRELERELRRQGWVTRDADGLTLSARRRCAGSGGTALRAGLRRPDRQAAAAQHDLRDAGAAGEVTGASRRWEFGDEQPLDVVRTHRPARSRRGRGRRCCRCGCDVEDFEVVETERRASAAVALCVDLSFSMVAEGRWGPMKQTALALSHLVATRFPQDALQIIGFGRYAMPLSQARAGRGRAGHGAGHQPAARAAAGRPAPAPALRTPSRWCWWSPTASRPRTCDDDGEAVLLLAAAAARRSRPPCARSTS